MQVKHYPLVRTAFPLLDTLPISLIPPPDMSLYLLYLTYHMRILFFPHILLASKAHGPLRCHLVFYWVCVPTASMASMTPSPNAR